LREHVAQRGGGLASGQRPDALAGELECDALLGGEHRQRGGVVAVPDRDYARRYAVERLGTGRAHRCAGEETGDEHATRHDGTSTAPAASASSCWSAARGSAAPYTGRPTTR